MSATFTLAAVVVALGNDDDYLCKERRGRNDFHVIQVDLRALTQKGTSATLDPIEKGALLGTARDRLAEAGYEVECRNGYRGNDNKFVAWPHLQMIKPGTGYGAQNGALTAQVAALTTLVTTLVAGMAQGNPAAAAALAGVAATGAITTAPETSETPEEPVTEEKPEGTFGG